MNFLASVWECSGQFSDHTRSSNADLNKNVTVFLIRHRMVRICSLSEEQALSPDNIVV